MPTNYSDDSIQKRLINTIIDLQRQIDGLRSNQTGWQGYTNLVVRASDPPVTSAGQFGMYFNSATGKVRKSYNGGAWADTPI